MAHDLGAGLSDLIGEGAKLLLEHRTKWAALVGEYTFQDIVTELEKPGRDPRDSFKAFQFREDIFEVKDLQEGMICPGIVSNVTNFGAFVDIGVHQDGLVHISELSHKFVEDPRKVVNPGDQVTVKVLKVDREKNQISLSMKLEAAPERRPQRSERPERPAGERQERSERAPRGGDSRRNPGQPGRRGPGADQQVARGDRGDRGGDRPRPGGGRQEQRKEFGNRPEKRGQAGGMRGGQPFNNPFAQLAGLSDTNDKNKR
jgi:uncharacterized protein